jgi:hypothetical protein
MDVRLFLFHKDEIDILEDWLSYHCHIFEKDRIHIVDHQSQEPCLKLIKDYGVDYQIYEGPFADKHSVLTDLMHKWRDRSDLLIPLDADEFVLALENGVISADKESIQRKICRLSDTQCKYKFAQFDAVPCIEPVIDAISQLTTFKPSKRDQLNPYMRKTFYPSKTFLNTDQGNHHGRIADDQNHFVDSGLLLLHYPVRGYVHFRRKYMRWESAYGHEHRGNAGRAWKSVYREVVRGEEQARAYYDSLVESPGDTFQCDELKKALLQIRHGKELDVTSGNSLVSDRQTESNGHADQSAISSPSGQEVMPVLLDSSGKTKVGRSDACSNCSACQGFEGMHVSCSVSRRDSISLISGKCALRKWPSYEPGDQLLLESKMGSDSCREDVIHDLIQSGQWRISESSTNNDDKVLLERISYTPGITLITPTGDRAESFKLCMKWMQRQVLDGSISVQWIIVDDGQDSIDATDLTMFETRGWVIRYLRRHPESLDPPHTLCLNMRRALPFVQHDKVLMIEDDDYYSSDYIATMSEWLNRADLVGEVGPKYYYLRSRSFNDDEMHPYACWCRTGFRCTVIPTIWQEALRSDQFALDRRVWSSWLGSTYTWFDESRDRALCIGIKGVPGRSGHTWEKPHVRHEDFDLTKFKKWLGNDAIYYDSMMSI